MSLHRRIFSEDHEYDEVGSKAQPEIQQALTRFRRLPLAKRRSQPVLYWLLGEGTPAFKMAQEDAAYQETSKGKQKCANCEFAYKKVVRDQFICSQIRDDIKPGAWCRLWEEGK